MNEITHNAPIRPSLELVETRCLALHIRIKAQAPTASHNVHIIEEATRVVGNNVENHDRNSGDLNRINMKTPPPPRKGRKSQENSRKEKKRGGGGVAPRFKEIRTCLKTPP